MDVGQGGTLLRFLPSFHPSTQEAGKSLSLRLPWSTQKVPDWPRPYKEPQSPKTKKTKQTKEGKRKEERKEKGRKENTWMLIQKANLK